MTATPFEPPPDAASRGAESATGRTSAPRGEVASPPFLLGFRRALYRGAGFSAAEMRRPLIGVANSWGEINPAARHLNVLTHKVKEGIVEAGGTPVEFVLSGLCDGTCAAAPGYNRYNLPWRDIAVAYLEAVARANMFDGIVFVGVCDEVVPAHLLAAVRLDLPSLLVLGGAMELGRDSVGREVWAGDMTAAYAGTLDGSVSEDEYLALEGACCGGAGACGIMGTANTMHLFAEACGLTLPGNAVAPGESPELEALAYAAGIRSVDLVREDLRPSAVLTRAALENGVRAIVAAGGSTCAVLHVLAIAAEAGLPLTLDDFDRLSRRTPLVADLRPSGRCSATDFHRSGGVLGLLATLAPLLDLEARTVGGVSLGEQVAAATADPAVIRPLDDPLAAEGGIAILRGTLAPDGAVFKQSGSAVRRFEGPARVFETEEAAGAAILAGDIVGGEVLVVRSSGPVGAPGMPCLYGSLWLLKSRGLDDRVALVTDGRLSGTIRGLAVAHVGPESGVGGPLAAVMDGDGIVIDVDERRIDLLVEESIVATRLAAAPPAPAPAPPGVLTQYRALVGPTHRGAVLAERSTRD